MLAMLSDQPLLAALSALLGLGAIFGALLGFAAIRFRVEGNPISDQINAVASNAVRPMWLSGVPTLFRGDRRWRCDQQVPTRW